MDNEGEFDVIAPILSAFVQKKRTIGIQRSRFQATDGEVVLHGPRVGTKM